MTEGWRSARAAPPTHASWLISMQLLQRACAISDGPEPPRQPGGVTQAHLRNRRRPPARRHAAVVQGERLRHRRRDGRTMPSAQDPTLPRAYPVLPPRTCTSRSSTLLSAAAPAAHARAATRATSAATARVAISKSKRRCRPRPARFERSAARDVPPATSRARVGVLEKRREGWTKTARGRRGCRLKGARRVHAGRSCFGAKMTSSVDNVIAGRRGGEGTTRRGTLKERPTAGDEGGEEEAGDGGETEDRLY